MTTATSILLIEDSPTQADQIAAQLRNYGFQVEIAGDGPDGLRAVDESEPDLILLDINLPSMSGYQVCSRLKRDQNTAHIPVIMLTASDSSDDILRGLNVGATDYIAKDAFAADNLITTLRALGLLESDGED
jgi:DNA-binding response OmpR family regulator